MPVLEQDGIVCYHHYYICTMRDRIYEYADCGYLPEGEWRLSSSAGNGAGDENVAAGVVE